MLKTRDIGAYRDLLVLFTVGVVIAALLLSSSSSTTWWRQSPHAGARSQR
jgi:hypothetical protein